LSVPREFAVPSFLIGQSRIPFSRLPEQ
jgi:hypothetical protein